MGAAERPFKALPTECLGFLHAPERLHHLNPDLFPFIGDPTGPVFIDGVDRAPRLLGATHLEKALSNVGRFFALLRDVGIHVALRVGNPLVLIGRRWSAGWAMSFADPHAVSAHP